MHYKLFSVIALVSGATLLVACDSGTKEQQSLMETSKQELALAVQERDQLLALVKEISADIDHIKNMDEMMASAASQSSDGVGQRCQLLKDIETLKLTMQNRKTKLAEMERELENSTLNNKELSEIVGAFHKQIDAHISRIESLKEQLLSANRHIVVLSGKVDSLSVTVANVTNELDTALLVSEQLENRLNICYYIVAAKSILKTHKIIESGFLRKTKTLEGDFDKGSFIAGDKRSLSCLPLSSPKARVLTNHPVSSYEVIRDGGNTRLIINDPDSFWSLSNYLVVQTD